ncbi:MAG: DUF6768 family protein [Pseudomonadota bacterium]
MNVDDEIRKALERQAVEDDQLLLPERGLFGMLAAAFTGRMRRWVWLTNLLAITASVFLVWSAWEFFTADQMDGRLFWGVCFVVSLQCQSMLKMWIFQEMNRASLAREIKRLEVLMAQKD